MDTNGDEFELSRQDMKGLKGILTAKDAKHTK